LAAKTVIAAAIAVQLKATHTLALFIKMKPIYVDNKYQLDLHLGGGTYGEVYQSEIIPKI